MFSLVWRYVKWVEEHAIKYADTKNAKEDHIINIVHLHILIMNGRAAICLHAISN